MFCNMLMVRFLFFMVLLLQNTSFNSFSIFEFCIFERFFLKLLKKESVKLKNIF